MGPVKRIYVQLSLPATKVPSEFSQPQVPSSGDLMQPAPSPLDSPSPLDQQIFVSLLSMLGKYSRRSTMPRGSTYVQKNVQQSSSAFMSALVGDSHV